MTPDLPLLIVTLPGRTVGETRAQAEVARDGGADLAEVRLDRWGSSERRRAGELFPAPLPLVATLRSRAEGGEGPDSPDARGTELEAAARLPFRWIDLEEARDAPLVQRLPLAPSLGRILSAHLPAGTPASEIARRLRATLPLAAVRKVVVPSPVGSLLRDLLPLLSEGMTEPCVLLTTGPSGALLRAWSRQLHFPFVFASLPDSGCGPSMPALEASQVPVDRLRLFFAGPERAPLFAVVGHPVEFSLSPYVHSRWMRVAGLPGLYVPLDIGSESEFVESIGPLAARGFLGLNVTHPWKRAALAVASRVRPGAQVCGAANCLTLREGEVEAENTDLAAILRRLDELRREGSWDGSELAVLGAGGAAAATLAAARELGAPAHLFARNGERARELARRFGAESSSRAEARPYALVVHATNVGRAGSGPLDVPLSELVGPGSRVLDWVYSPEDPSVRMATEARGGQYEDGWRLLIYQAATSFGVWWGSEPEAAEVAACVAEGPCMG